VAHSRHLCLAGGDALTSGLKGRMRGEGPFEQVFIQPAANDAGTALGGALVLAHARHRLPRREALDRVDLGPAFSDADCLAAVRGMRVETPADLVERT